MQIQDQQQFQFGLFIPDICRSNSVEGSQKENDNFHERQFPEIN